MLSQTQKLLLFSHLIHFSSAGKCPFGFGSSEDEAEADQPAPPKLDDLAQMAGSDQAKRNLAGSQYPADILTCPSGQKVLKTVEDFANEEYEAVVESVNELYDDTADKAEFAGCLVRLAGHDLMDFRYTYEMKEDGTMRSMPSDQSGGSDGCINFDDVDNKGLVECIGRFNLQAAYADHCGVVSLADFIVIAAEAVMGRTAKSYNEADEYAEGTLARVFRDQFKSGRTTVESCDWNTGLMPDPEEGCTDMMDLFGSHVFKFQPGREKKKLTAAILGAHTLGSAKLENSGYQGTWSSPGSEGVFDNDYYIQMLTRGWGPDLAVGGNPERNQWKTVDNGPTGQHLMLNSDLCLAYDNNSEHQACMAENNFNNRSCRSLQNKGTPILATAGNCCAWTHKNALFNKGVFDANGTGNLCGQEVPRRGRESQFNQVRNACCANEGSDSSGDCDSAAWPKGQSFPMVLAFAADENEWLESYAQAWKIATENGHLDLNSLNPDADTEELYDCGKLRTRRMCQRDDKCSWVQSTELDRRGRPRKHCALAEEGDDQEQVQGQGNRGGQGNGQQRQGQQRERGNSQRGQGRGNNPPPPQGNRNQGRQGGRNQGGRGGSRGNNRRP